MMYVPAGHEIRAFWAYETTHFAAGQPKIILRQLSDKQSKIDKDLPKYVHCFCAFVQIISSQFVRFKTV